MTLTERISLWLTALLTLSALFGSVWYAAVTVNNLIHGVDSATEAVVDLNRTVTKYVEITSEQQIAVSELITRQGDLEKERIILVYIDEVEGYVLMSEPDGTTFKLQLHQE